MNTKLKLGMIILLLISGICFGNDSIPKIGIGVNIRPLMLPFMPNDYYINEYSGRYYFYEVPPAIAHIYIPITNNNTNRRAELYFGIQGPRDYGSDFLFQGGFGVFKIRKFKDKVNTYLGPRFSIVSAEKYSLRTLFNTAFCMGGEYFASTHFTLGGEAQFQYTTNFSKYNLSTAAPLFIRWYF